MYFLSKFYDLQTWLVEVVQVVNGMDLLDYDPIELDSMGHLLAPLPTWTKAWQE